MMKGEIVIVDGSHVGRVVEMPELHERISNDMIGIAPTLAVSALVFEWIERARCTLAPMYVVRAWECGGEARENGSRRKRPNRNDRDSIASHHPAVDWNAMPEEDRILAQQAFAHGWRATRIFR